GAPDLPGYIDDREGVPEGGKFGESLSYVFSIRTSGPVIDGVCQAKAIRGVLWANPTHPARSMRMRPPHPPPRPPRCLMARSAASGPTAPDAINSAAWRASWIRMIDSPHPVVETPAVSLSA